MARQRRGRSRGPELRGTLGTLLRTTLAQAGAVREVIERGARQGRAKLDEVRSVRRRDQALAELGEVVLELIERGEAPELEGHPDVAAALDGIADTEPDDDRGARGRDRPVAGRDFVAPPSRARFDRRDARGESGDARREDPDGGAVSSRAWRPPAPSAPGDGRVWRPSREHIDAPVRSDDAPAPAPAPAPGAARRTPAQEPGARFQVREPRPGSAAAPPRPRGGIAFEDDEDLADYMHPEDVPGTDKK